MPYVEVWVDKASIDDFTTEQLKRELEKRKQDDVDDARENLIRALHCLQDGDTAEAEYLLERTLYPKFKSFDQTMQLYASARKNDAGRAALSQGEG
jgi:hemerythrin superfamily protein